MLDIAQSCIGQDSRMYKLPEKELFSVKLDQSNCEAQSIENCRKRISAEF